MHTQLVASNCAQKKQRPIVDAKDKLKSVCKGPQHFKAKTQNTYRVTLLCQDDGQPWSGPSNEPMSSGDYKKPPFLCNLVSILPWSTVQTITSSHPYIVQALSLDLSLSLFSSPILRLPASLGTYWLSELKSWASPFSLPSKPGRGWPYLSTHQQKPRLRPLDGRHCRRKRERERERGGKERQGDGVSPSDV